MALLMAFRSFRSALRDVIRPADGEDAGEQEDLFPVIAQPGAEGVPGVVPATVPVPQPVVDDPGGNGGVVAFQKVIECLLVQSCAARRLSSRVPIRWESDYGWTRRGYGQVAEKDERSPACPRPVAECPLELRRIGGFPFSSRS